MYTFDTRQNLDDSKLEGWTNSSYREFYTIVFDIPYIEYV